MRSELYQGRNSYPGSGQHAHFYYSLGRKFSLHAEGTNWTRDAIQLKIIINNLLHYALLLLTTCY